MQLTQRLLGLKAEALEFAPGLVRIQDHPPSPLPRVVVLGLAGLLALLLGWAAFGRLDIIAVAPGKIVPQRYLQIVQPAEAGIVEALLVKEGDRVAAGQVLVRMDTRLAQAETQALAAELALKRLQLRRIEAQLNARSLLRQPGDPANLFVQVEAQHRTRRQAYLDSLGEQEALLAKARADLASAREVKTALESTVPVLAAQDEGWQKLVDEGYAGQLMALDKKRARLEKEGELKAQAFAVASLTQSIAQAEQRIAQIRSSYRSALRDEQVEAQGRLERLQQEWAKQTHRQGLLELKAPQAGLIKDLSTHTPGTVVQPGSVLMTLVPLEGALLAEVWVDNADAGRVDAQQPVKVKLAAYPFQKYGMLSGRVQHLSPDASERPEARGQDEGAAARAEPAPLHFRALVALDQPYLERDGVRFALSPGMQVSAEINLGSRTVLEYLLSPVQKTVQEAGRER